jgi:hypothetical protein
MNVKRLVVATLVGGIVANVLDYVVHGMLLAQRYYSQLTSLFRQDTPIQYFVIGDFVAVLVLVMVYDRVHASFGGGARGGAIGGFWAGLLVSFPSYIFIHLQFAGFPYALSWIWTIYTIVWYVVVGAVVGALYRK